LVTKITEEACFSEAVTQKLCLSQAER